MLRDLVGLIETTLVQLEAAEQ